MTEHSNPTRGHLGAASQPGASTSSPSATTSSHNHNHIHSPFLQPSTSQLSNVETASTSSASHPDDPRNLANHYHSDGQDYDSDDMDASARNCMRDGDSASPPPAPYIQPPVTSSLSTVTSGDGWSMVPRDHPSYKGKDPAEPTNRRCVTLSQSDDHSASTATNGSESSYDVPFGERPSPAVINFPRAALHGLADNTSPTSNRTASIRTDITAGASPSGAHRGGLRGIDESLETQTDKATPSTLGSTQSADSNGAPVKAGLVTTSAASGSSASLTPLVPPSTRKLCVRHQRMADEGTTARLQKSIECLPLSDQTAVNTVWSLFSSSSHSRRALILQGILTMCCFSQLSLLSSELALAIRIDPFSLFPREVSLKVLGHLDAISLGRAAQVSRSWRQLADDDLLWRNMCEQHIERKCEKCGWGLPLLSERRRRAPGPGVQVGTPESRQLTIEPQPGQPAAPGSGNLKRTITAAANAAALEKQSRSRASSPSAIARAGANATSSLNETDGDAPPVKRQRSNTNGSSAPTAKVPTTGSSNGSSSGKVGPAVPKTRPWKVVYCERLAIERNWRRGRYTARTMTGHTDGIMCLQYSDSLAHPAFPVVITGSYDRTARIWNLATGEQLRVLEGHTRGVRCLQFDEAKLITGSMDRTLKIWNWRTGALMRTLEGHTEGIVCLHFNEDTLASGSADSNIKIWNFLTGECYTLRGHRDWVNAVTLWTGPAAQRRLKQRREAAAAARTSGQMRPIKDDDPEAAGTFLFSASDDGTIRLWDLGLRECLLVYEGHVGQVQSLKLIMMDEDAVRKLMRGGSSGLGAENGQPSRSRVNSVSNAHANGNGAGLRDHRSDAALQDRSRWDENDRNMMSVEDQQSYYLNDETSASTVRQRATDTSATAVATSNARCTTSGPASSTATNGAVPGSHRTSAGIPDRFYYSGSRPSDKDTAQRRQRNKIEPTLLRVQERLCAAGLVDPLPLDAEMGDLDLSLAEEESHSGDDEQLEPKRKKKKDGHRPVLVSGSLDNTLKIWDVRTGKCIRTLFGHVEGVWSLDVDKLRIVSASHDRTIKIWDRDTGSCQNTLVGHKGAVTCLSLGDDKIVSGSDDGDLKVWSFAAATPAGPVPTSTPSATASRLSATSTAATAPSSVPRAATGRDTGTMASAGVGSDGGASVRVGS